MVRLPKQQGCHERDDQRGAKQIESVAEGQDKSLFLDDVADRHQSAMRRFRAVGDAMIEEILRQLLDADAGGLFQQRH